MVSVMVVGLHLVRYQKGDFSYRLIAPMPPFLEFGALQGGLRKQVTHPAALLTCSNGH